MDDQLDIDKLEGNVKLSMNAIFTGRVQGVGFRATCQDLAVELELSGSVRNLPNGTVAIDAEGQKASLELLLQRLKNRFPNSQTSSVNFSRSLDLPLENTFKIL